MVRVCLHSALSVCTWRGGSGSQAHRLRAGSKEDSLMLEDTRLVMGSNRRKWGGWPRAEEMLGEGVYEMPSFRREV